MHSQSQKISSKALKRCLANDSTGMGFLFTKVDSSVLNAVGDYPCFLVDFCLHRCLEESAKSSCLTENVIFYSAVIKRILTIAQDFSFALNSETKQRLVDYVFRSWDFTAEVVCHEAVDIFSGILTNHCLNCVECRARKGCPWSDDLANQVFSMESKCRARFKCLLILLESFSTYMKLLDADLLDELYSLIGNPTLAVVISGILSLDLSCSTSHWDLHVSYILSSLSSEDNEIRSAVKDRLLPKLIKFKLLKNEFLPMLLDRMKENSSQYFCLDSLLSVARFLILSNKKCDSYKYWYDLVPVKTMRYAVLHSNAQVRLAAWLLLCEHPQRTHSFSEEDLLLIRAFIVSNMVEQQPAVRLKVLAGIRKILSRMAETSEQIIKREGCSAEEVQTYNGFVRSLLSLAFDSLSPAANFSRRVMALAILKCIYIEGVLKPNGKTLFVDQLHVTNELTLQRYQAVVDCLDDAFQLCQTTALDLLAVLPVDEDFDFSEFKKKTIDMMKSIRSHSTLAAGYRMQFYTKCHPNSLKDSMEYLVDECQRTTSLAMNNLINITRDSVHPWMNTIALLLESAELPKLDSDNLAWWTNFVRKRLLPLCFNVADLVTPVVHSMSPEGYIPEETLIEMASCSSENGVQMAAEVSQLLLACCWRAHKHVSSILAWAIVNLCTLSILTPEDVHRIGDFYWLQLTECKHCGAFETAVEGFSSLCSYLWKSDDALLPKPVEWLRQILEALEGRKDSQNLCSTRRSAGVPHLISTILATEPHNHPSKSMEIAMSSLLEMTNKSVTLRIHSLNTLKAVFASAALGERVTPALEWACRVAVSGCSAATWPERNAAAQLAAALRGRIFGVAHKSQRDLHVDSKNRQSAYEFFSRFPSLYGYLYEQLCVSNDEFSVYPILIFLTHLFPSNAGVVLIEGKENYETARIFPLSPFIPVLLRVLLWCRAEKLRRLAVAALTAVATPKDIQFVLDWITSADLKNIRQNHVHAVLLLMASMLESDKCTEDVKSKIREMLAKLVGLGDWLKWCDMNKNLVMLLCNDLSLSFDTNLDLKDMVLAKRPLAHAIIRGGRLCEAQLASDFQLRLEVYRHMRLHGSRSEVFKTMEKFVVKDLELCRIERDIACILDVLHLNRDFVSERKSDFAAYVSSRVCRVWRMPETRALAYRLLVFVSDQKEPSVDELKWMESCVYGEDEVSKRIALEMGAHRLEQGDGSEVVPILVPLLQDEDSCVREQASSLLSRLLVRNGRTLNPDVCYRLITEKCTIARTERDDHKAIDGQAEVLFDVSAVNPYAESRVFGDYDEVRTMVAELSQDES
ncbi:hypothetical protein Q1695_009746 [Nippostrongylus brasiliensis]|nr:hypothetical protein Q1695_009746 [Nippostrongylus brasiliensis]